MNLPGIALALSLFTAQDDLDGGLRNLAEKLSKDGISGKLAGVLPTDAGLQAAKEWIELLVSVRASRIERDSIGHYEDFLFTRDSNGDLRLRADRRPEFEALARRIDRAPRSMADFNRRCDAIVKRLGDSELDKRARVSWSDPAFRVAFFHRHPAELRERDDEELLDELLFRGLVRPEAGGRRVGGPYAQDLRDRMAATYSELEAVKTYEAAFQKVVSRVADEEAQKVAGSEAGAHFLLGRLLRQISEGAQTPIGAIQEADPDKSVELSLSFTRKLAEFVPEIRAFEKAAAALKEHFEKQIAEIAAGGPEETALIDFLRNDRARLLLAERVLGRRQEQKAAADNILNATLEDGFIAEGDKLSVKKGRYVDDTGADSLAALDAELNNIPAEFEGSIRYDFERIAQMSVEPAVIALFESRSGAFLLAEHRDTVIARLVDDEQRKGLDYFTRAYLMRLGDAYVVRPDRARRVEEILKRVEELKKAAAAAAEAEKDK